MLRRLQYGVKNQVTLRNSIYWVRCHDKSSRFNDKGRPNSILHPNSICICCISMAGTIQRDINYAYVLLTSLFLLLFDVCIERLNVKRIYLFIDSIAPRTLKHSPLDIFNHIEQLSSLLKLANQPSSWIFDEFSHDQLKKAMKQKEIESTVLKDVIVNKKPLQIECQASKVKGQGHPKNRIWKVSSMGACVNLFYSYGFLDIEANVKMLTDRQTDKTDINT